MSDTPNGGTGPAANPVAERFTPVLLALIAGQICLHSSMAGLRMAAPLQALRQGHAQWAVGLLMGLFAAAPIVLALHAGRIADRYGFHRPMHMAVAMTVSGGLLAVLAQWAGSLGLVLMGAAAALSGAGTNFGLIAIQRTAGRTARDGTELKQVFSWLGLAPALANVVGPVLTGGLIDWGGFSAAYAVLCLLPLLTLLWTRRVPAEPPHLQGPTPAGQRSWDLLRSPDMRRLLLVNWLVSSSWDVHSFLVPILGHERGFSAFAIGMVLGVFASSVALVRLLIPVLAHRLRESQVLSGAMLGTAAVFAVYPLVHTPWLMAVCAVFLGLALGSVQPMIMTALHQMTPHARQGEALALRSMTINFSSASMPLIFGVVGTALGASALFWLMGAAVGSGSWQARRLGNHARAEPAKP